MLEILNRICAGDGREGDIELLEEIAETVQAGRSVRWAGRLPTR